MKEKKEKNRLNKPNPELTKPVAIAGVGASAGGLDAFRQLIEAIPEKSGIAYVFIQHQHPNHKSLLPAILKKITPLPVVLIKDDIILAPDHIYLVPGTKIIEPNNDSIKLKPRQDNSKKRIHHPIDIFFTTLAELYQNEVIGIILSGTATDGTTGLKAIKDAGGITIAQTPATAAFSEMPGNAIKAGVVDFILAPEKIPQKLKQVAGITNLREENKSDETELIFNEILSILRISKVMDFTYYKQSTVRRRITRRIVLNKLKNLKEYFLFLKENKKEQDALYQDLLIPVTSFFRDERIFNSLCETVFPQLIKNKSAEGIIRIWVAGCSTGQEAYSMAICFKEYLGHKKENVQIFATDLSEPAIQKARAGVYTKTEIESVGAARLKEYFTYNNGSYRINKELRDICVFAVHNFLKDPPFSKIDFISCRNVLIYMDTYLQKKALATFHYALNPKGLLLLGKSENTIGITDLFSASGKTEKIFTRKDVPSSIGPLTINSKNKNSPAIKQPFAMEIPKSDFQKSADDMMQQKFMPPGVVINDAMDIVLFRGNTSNYLEQTHGKPSHNLLKMARKGLTFELRSIIHKLKKQLSSGGIDAKESLTKEDVPLQINNRQHLVSIEAMLLPHTIEPHYLIVFHEQSLPESKKLSSGKINSLRDEDALRIQQLENELFQLREDMRGISEDQESSNEELQSTNEELLSSNEELQSLNEELETSKEELQSTIEELTVVNQEMVNLNELLGTEKEYAEAIITTIPLPLLVIDKDLKIRIANQQFFEKFELTERDTERRLIYDVGNGEWNTARIKEFLESIIPQRKSYYGFEITLDFKTLGSRTLLLNAQEIKRNKEETLTLLVIEDITESKKAVRLIEDSEKQLQDIFRQAPAAIAIIEGKSQRYILANKLFQQLFGRTEEQLIGKTIREVYPEAEGQGVYEIFDTVYKSGEAISAHEYPAYYEDNGIKKTGYYDFVAQPIKNNDGNVINIMVHAVDVTEQIEARKKLEESEAFSRSILDSSPDCIKILDDEGRLQFMNSNGICLMEIDDFTKFKNKFWSDLWHKKDQQMIKDAIAKAHSGKKVQFQAFTDTAKGNSKWWDVIVLPIIVDTETNKARRILAVSRDITEYKEATLKVEKSEQQVRSLIESAPFPIGVYTGKEMIITFANDSILDVWGKGKNVVGKSYHEILPELENQDIFKQLDDVFTTGIAFHNKNQRVDLVINGKLQPFYFNYSFTPLFDAEGKVYGIMNTAADVTDLNLAKQKIERSELQYRQLANSLPSLIWQTDANGNQTFASKRWKEFTGLDPADEDTFVKMVHPKDFNSIMKTWTESLATGSLYTHEVRLKNKAGEYEWFQVNGEPIINDKGEIDKWIGAFTNINERKQTEIALKKSENHFRELTDTVPAIIWITRPDGYCTYLNKNWYQYTGQSKEEGEGYGWLDATYPEDKEEAGKIFLKANAEQIPFNLTYRLKDRNGNYRWALDLGSPKYNAAGVYEGMIGTVIDIHEQKMAEQAIKQNEEKLQGAIAAVQGIVWTNNAKGEMEGLQPGWASLTGQSYEEYQGYGWAKAVHPEDAQNTIDAWNEAVKERKTFVFEHRILLKNNEWGHFSVQAIPLLNDDGTIREWVGVHTDISEKRKAEIKIRESEKRFRNLADHSPMFVYIIEPNAEATISYWNKTWLDYTGQTKEEALGRAWDGIIHKDDVPAVLDIYGPAFENKKPYFIPSIRVKRHDDEYRWHAFQANPRYGTDGTFIGYIGVGYDVHERKLAEDALKESEERFRLMAELLPEKVSYAEANGNVIYYNKNWLTYTGYDEVALINDGWKKVIHPDDRDEAERLWKESVKTGHYFEIEFRIKNKNGEYKWHISRAVPLKDENGKVTKWLGSATEIQEQKVQKIELEKAVSAKTHELKKANAELLEKNIELDKINKELESFTYISSHDLQEPLRKIQTISGLLLRNEYDSLSVKGKDYFQRMSNAAGRMQLLIKDLLTYSHTSSGLQKFEQTQLNKIAVDVLEDFKEIIQEKKATVEINLVCEIHVIPFQFRQLLYNLIGNALKFISPDKAPHVIIKSELGKGKNFNEQTLNPEANYCHISIVDNGIGFNPLYKDKIFEVFQRLHGKDVYSGTGIGLAIVKKIVDNHHGIITATSQENEGARFDIYLPHHF